MVEDRLSPHVCGDPPGEARRLHTLHDAAFGGPSAAGTPREVITASWRRSLAAGVDPGVDGAPLVYEPEMIGDARSEHPLDQYLPLLRGILRTMADLAAHLMVITDGDGHILWSEGPHAVRRKADVVGLAAGFCWSEGSVGTNGIGTALAARRPSYVYSAEHLARVLHPWSCAAAPISDPDSGRIVGCVDISATIRELHPATVALSEATARLTEAQLALDMHARDDRLRARYHRHLTGTSALVTPTGRILAGGDGTRFAGRLMIPEHGGALILPDGRSAIAEPVGEIFLLQALSPVSDRPLLTLRVLGDLPTAWLDGRQIPISPRHAELLTLLALNPKGLTADQFSHHLYGDEGNPVTLRCEIHRLRAQLGGVVSAKPYRLDCDIDADVVTVRRLLAGGQANPAAQLYRGPLLPRSESPAIRAERDELSARLRRLLIWRGGVDALWAYVQTESGQDDLEVLDRLATILPPADPRVVSVRLRQTRLVT